MPFRASPDARRRRRGGHGSATAHGAAGRRSERGAPPLSRKSLKRHKAAKRIKSNPHDFNGLREAKAKPFVSHAK